MMDAKYYLIFLLGVIIGILITVIIANSVFNSRYIGTLMMDYEDPSGNVIPYLQFTEKGIRTVRKRGYVVLNVFIPKTQK